MENGHGARRGMVRGVRVEPGAVHVWLRAVAHHTVKGVLEHVDGGHGWGSWRTVKRVAHGLAMGGRRYRFEDGLWDG